MIFKQTLRYILLFSLVYYFFSCGKPSKSEATKFDSEGEQITKHFSIFEKESYTILEISEPFVGSSSIERYLLYPKNENPPNIEGITHFIPVPVSRVGINSTTHLGLIEPLGQIDKISAASNLNLYYSPQFQENVENGEIQSIGQQRIEQESLINEKLDLLFSYVIDANDLKEVKRLRELGQNVILIAEYMEQDPLEKAAWIKAMALFFGESAELKADSILAMVKENYDSLKKQSNEFTNQPEVMIGYPWKGTWYVSGGNSFQAKLIEDAGANYTWKTFDQAGSIPLTIERVLDDALEADFWINCGNVTNFSTIEKDQALLKNFKAFKNQVIYHHYKRSNASGANDYWEQGIVRPDLILADLVSIFHGVKDSSQSLYFYEKLAP